MSYYEQNIEKPRHQVESFSLQFCIAMDATHSLGKQGPNITGVFHLCQPPALSNDT